MLTTRRSPPQSPTARSRKNVADANSDNASDGGGIYSDAEIPLVIDHTIVAQNINFNVNPFSVGSKDIQVQNRVWLDLRHSLVGDRSGTFYPEAPIGSPDANGNLIGYRKGSGVIDPLLAPLADNGGPTLTHALLEGSPAIDAGDPSFTPPPDYDQRGVGFPRVLGDAIDMGAFELLTVEVQIDNLLAAVQSLVDEGALNKGQGNALSVKLIHAQEKFDAGKTRVALNLPDAFTNQVTDLIANGVLTPAEGKPLLDAADELRMSIAAIDQEEMIADLALASYGLEDDLFADAKQAGNRGKK